MSEDNNNYAVIVETGGRRYIDRGMLTLEEARAEVARYTGPGTPTVHRLEFVKQPKHEDSWGWLFLPPKHVAIEPDRTPFYMTAYEAELEPTLYKLLKVSEEED